MKIKSVDIASFGKFKNYKIDFSDGFNVIYGQNEAGKSTVMSFIKMMFYGNGGRVSDLDKNLRKKYMPWDSSLMAGSIEFSHRGKNYRLMREFKGSNSTDKITLINIDIDTEVSVSGKGDIGSSVFGLSEAAFEKSVFISTLGAPAKDSAAESEINGKLSNIAASGDQDISQELVASRLRKAKEALMSRSKKVGSYDKAVAELSSLEEEIESARERENQAVALEVIIAEKEAEASAVKTEGDRLFAIMKKAELFKKRSALTKYIEAYGAAEKAKSALTLPDGSLATKEYADSIKDAVSNITIIEKSLSDKNTAAEAVKDEISALSTDDESSASESLNARKQELENNLRELDSRADTVRESLTILQIAASVKPQKKPNLAFLIIGLALTFIFGVAAAFTVRSNTPLLYGEIVGAVVGLVLFVLGFVLKRSVTDDDITEDLMKTQSELDGILKRIAATEDEFSAVNSEINTKLIEQGGKKALLSAKQTELLAKQEEVISVKSQLLDAENVLSVLCKPFGLISDKSDALQIATKIERHLSELSSANIMLNLAADSTNCQSYEEAINRLNDLNLDETLRDISPEEAESAKDKIKAFTLESGKLREELATLKGKLKTLTASGKTVPLLELQKTELESSIASQKKFCDSADIAMEALAEAAATMRQSFGGALEADTARIFAALTDNAYSSLDISKDLEIKVGSDGVFGAKEWQFLSAGTVDQAYLALRLALIKLISEEKDSLPLIIDDCLAQYDDQRADKAMNFLNEFSKEHQLIFFTCHTNIKKTAEKLGINTINM